MATEYELTISDYLSIMRRRALYLIGIFVAAMLAAITVAFSIPPSYRSTGTILVESPLVSDNTVPGAIKNDFDERIDIIKQRVMTRDNLLQMIKRYGLFKEGAGSMSTTDLIEKMRNRVVVESISSNTSKHGQPTIAFTISFEDQHPEVALEVANDLVSRFLQLNQHESMRARAESDLYDIDRNIRSTSEELRTLQAQLAGAKAGPGTFVAAGPSQTLPGTTGDGNPSQTLQTLKAEYTKLLAVDTESHPDVRALKSRIAALEQAAKEQASSMPEPKAVPANNFSPVAYKARMAVDAAKAKLDSLMQQKKMLQGKIAQFEHSMEQAPGLDRDGAAQSLQSENKSERFSLLEPPVLPDKPFKPNRMKILVLGFFFAMALSGGVVTALESIDQRIRGTEALAHVVGCRPLVVVPYLSIRDEELRRKLMLKWGFIAAVITLLAVMVAIHFLYMPLNILFTKILARLP